MHTIHYTVDGEEQVSNETDLTPSEILSRAGIDAATHYLVQIQGHHQESYQNRPDEKIHLHNNLTFISVYSGPTPVS